MKSTLHNQDSVQISISKFVVLKLQKNWIRHFLLNTFPFFVWQEKQKKFQYILWKDIILQITDKLILASIINLSGIIIVIISFHINPLQLVDMLTWWSEMNGQSCSVFGTLNPPKHQERALGAGSIETIILSECSGVQHGSDMSGRNSL